MGARQTPRPPSSPAWRECPDAYSPLWQHASASAPRHIATYGNAHYKLDEGYSKKSADAARCSNEFDYSEIEGNQIYRRCARSIDYTCRSQESVRVALTVS
jgi:hypothetical protein